MRLVKNNINTRDGTGTATLIPQEPEDMWHLFNLIRPQDVLRAPTIRRIVTAGADTSRAESSMGKKTVHTTLSIRVADKALDFDPLVGQLRVSGTVSEPSSVPEISVGQFHTIELELHRQLTLEKGSEWNGVANEGWDSVAIQMLKEATDVKRLAESYAVVMSEGLANICLLTEHQTILRQRVEMSIPKKRSGLGADSHDKSMAKFYETVMATLFRHLDIAEVTAPEAKTPPLILASPGFTANALHRYMLDHAQRVVDKPLLSYLRNSVVVAHSSSGHLHSLNEALKQPAVMAKLSDTKYARETQVMEKFMEMLREDNGKAWYGPGEVERAVNRGAVGRGGGVLLISNRLFRSNDIDTRRRWVKLVDRVRDVEGGEVRVLSSAHESGKRLEGLGDIGAILTYPIFDLDEDEDDATNGHTP